MIIFQKTSLEVFLGTIAQYDKGILEDKLLHKDRFFPDLLLEKNAKLNEGKYTLNIEEYRKDYYASCFEKVNIRDLCHEYLVGMQWVLSYYTRGVPDWKWCFKHHYAPFAHELAEHITDFKFSEKRQTEPTTPFQQLLSVLPPESAGLIPVPLSQLLTDSKSRIKNFCPKKFTVDLSGKMKEWEGIVLLPMVDFAIVMEEYFKHIDKVSSIPSKTLTMSNKSSLQEFKSIEATAFLPNMPIIADNINKERILTEYTGRLMPSLRH